MTMKFSLSTLLLLLSSFCHSSAFTTTPSNAFVNRASSSRRKRLRTQSHILYQQFQNNEEDDENIFYDDFGNFVIGGGNNDDSSSNPIVEQNDFPPSSDENNNNNEWMDTLNQRLSTLKSATAQRQDLLTKNWSKGNWNVRGFALDPTDPTIIDDNNENSDEERRRRLDGNDDSNAAAASGATFPTSFIGTSIDFPHLPFKSSSPEQQPEQKGSSSTGPILISKIATDTSQHNPDILAVGRTDGTIVLVKIGTQYLTKFISIPKIVYDEEKWAPDEINEEDNGENEEEEEIDAHKAEENAPRLKIQSELMDANEALEKLRGDDVSNFNPDSFQTEGEDDVPRRRSPYNYSPEEQDDDNMEDAYTEEEMLAQIQQQAEQNAGIPFQIIHQFNAAADTAQRITALLYHDDVIYTAAGDSGDVQIWKIPNEVNLSVDSGNQVEEEGEKMVIPWQTLSRAHSDTIVSLKTLSSSSSQYEDDDEEHNLLLSASIDGSFALWDLHTGDLIHRCQLSDDVNDDAISIQCADVDTSSKEGHVIYFGLNTGQVVAYTVKDVIVSATTGSIEEGGNGGDACPIPSCSFVAYESSGKEGRMMIDGDYGDSNNGMKGVTSILCAGKGLLSSGSVSTSSIITGGADGTVKQWEMMARKIPPNPQSPSQTTNIKLEHWPRLSTQRMKQCAHLFTGHYGPITALACIDTTKILSAGVDGTVRIWNRAEGGTELYRMDGFTSDISSLCLEEDRLITNGMEEYVCLHDFEVEEIEEGMDYNLEDDW